MCAAIPRTAAQEITAALSKENNLQNVTLARLTVGSVNMSRNAAKCNSKRQEGRRLLIDVNMDVKSQVSNAGCKISSTYVL